MTWTSTRATMVRVGDLTPAGRVDEVELLGSLRLVHLTIGGVTYGRRFDDYIDIEAGT